MIRIYALGSGVGASMSVQHGLRVWRQGQVTIISLAHDWTNRSDEAHHHQTRREARLAGGSNGASTIRGAVPSPSHHARPNGFDMMSVLLMGRGRL